MRDELRPYVGKLMVVTGWKSSIKKTMMMIKNCKLWLWDGKEALDKICMQRWDIETDHLWISSSGDKGFSLETWAPDGSDGKVPLYVKTKTVGEIHWYTRANRTTDICIDNHPILSYEMLLNKYFEWKNIMRPKLSPPEYYRSAIEQLEFLVDCINRQGMCRNYGEDSWGRGYIVSEKENLDYAKAELIKINERFHELMLINEKALNHSKLQEFNNSKRTCDPTFAKRAMWASSSKRSKPKPFGTLTKHGRNHTRAMGKDRKVHA
ncbi:MAG: hypothetical protein VW879_03445 [Opitutae bacterium]